jgi:hypothetical protein
VIAAMGKAAVDQPQLRLAGVGDVRQADWADWAD